MKQLQFTALVFDKAGNSSRKTISIEVSDETADMLQKDIEAAEKRKGHSPYETQAEGQANIECSLICGSAEPDGSINENNAFGCRGL